MSLEAVGDLALSVMFDVMGVPATVTRPAPNNAPIVTRAVWLTQVTEGLPGGMELQRREVRRVVVLRRVDVPTVPLGTVIQAPERADDAVQMWRVDGLDHQEADHHRVVVLLKT